MANLTANKVITDTTIQKVIDVPAGVPFAYLSISATNKGGLGQVLNTWIAPTGATPGDVDLIEAGASIDAGGRYTDEGVLILQGESYYVKGSGTDIVVRVAMMNEIISV